MSTSGVTVQITSEDWTSLKAAIVAVQDATREAELAAARAKVAVGEAVSKQITLVRRLAAVYSFDPDDRIALAPDKTSLVILPPSQGGA